MAVINFTTDSFSHAVLWEETAKDSGQFTQRQFTCGRVTADFDTDSATVKNIVVHSLGDYYQYSDMNYYSDYFYDAIRFLQSEDNSYGIRQRQSSAGYKHDESLYIAKGIQPPITYSSFRSGVISYIQSLSMTDTHYRAYFAYHWFESLGYFILFYQNSSNSKAESDTLRFSYEAISRTSEPSTYSALVSIFNGVSEVDVLSLNKVYPGMFFSKGQSSQVEFQLANKSGAAVSATITYECAPSEGWSWNADTHTLTYNYGSYWTIVNAESVYDDYSYYGTAVFKPPAGTSPYAPGGFSGFGGGNGNFGVGVPNDNVVQDIPNGSNFGYVGGSMFTHYALSGNQVEHFGEWLWTDSLGLSLWKTLMEKVFNETADGLISLMAFPFNISTLPNMTLVDGTLIAGNLNTGVPARILGSPYTQVDWGTIQLTEYWGNFLDYTPHTKIELYLPWSTGFVSIDPHQVMPDPITKTPVSLSVKTNIDLQKGTCTHNVQAGTTLLGVYEGQCGYEIPLLASNFSAKLAGATVAAVAGLAMGAAGVSAMASSGIKAGMASAQVGRVLNIANKIVDPAGVGFPTQSLTPLARDKLQAMLPTAPSKVNENATYRAISKGSVPHQIASTSSVATAKQPVHVARNGNFSGSSAGSSIQYPFVIVSRPKQDVPNGYGHHFGYPSNISAPLSTLKGYTEVGAIHITGVNALPDELAELEDILKGGFII